MMSTEEMVSPISPDGSTMKSKKSPRLQYLQSKKHDLSKRKPAKVPIVAVGGAVQPRYMTDTKRTKLEAIRDKSNMKAKRERVRNIITKKLIGTFGAKNRGVIESFVDEVIHNHEGGITSSDLLRIQAELQEILKHKPPPVIKKVVEETPAVDEEELAASRSSLQLPAGIAWKAIHAYEVAIQEQNEKDQRQREEEKKSKLRVALEKQMEAAREEAMKNRRNDILYAKHVTEDVEHYAAEEARKREDMMEKMQIQKRFREEQIAEQHRRKQEELDQMRQHELETNARIQAEIDAEKALLAEKKAISIERNQRVLEENEKLRLFRLEQKKKDAEYDQKLMADYAKKMDEEAAEREGAFAKRLAALEMFASKFSNDGAGKVEKDERLKEERLLLAEQERKEKADAAEEARRKRESKRKLEEAARSNLEMIRQKAERAERERLEDLKLAKMSVAEIEKYRNDEAERLRKEAEQKYRFRRVLDHQLQEREANEKLDDMTKEEKVMNYNTLNAIQHADKKIRDALKKKLKL